MARTVTVASAAANRAKQFSTNATVWSQLQDEIRAQGLSLDNVEAVMNPGNVTLSQADAVLATGDFKVYLVPTKNKAGGNLSEADIQELMNAIRAASTIAEEQKGHTLKDALIQTVEEFYDVDLEDLKDRAANDNLDEDVRKAHEMSNKW